jgi:hypothetical protein
VDRASGFRVTRRLISVALCKGLFGGQSHTACRSARSTTGCVCSQLPCDLVFRALACFPVRTTGGGWSDRLPPPPSGMGPTARNHRASAPQAAELTADHITFFQL